ncbi:hypothetical protein Pelo_18896 [Pelomyxa schiedti]|nr:hypothetical protein Pelo_18896 [Pelomyxa schiedti]
MSSQLGYCPETRVCRGTKWAVLWHPLLGGIVILRMCGGLERVRCGGGGKEDFCVVGLRGYVTCACMINDDEAALVAPSPAVEGKTDMVCVDLKTSFESHNLAVTQEFLGLSFTVDEVFHSKKHKVIAATWGFNTRGDRAWNLSSGDDECLDLVDAVTGTRLLCLTTPRFTG